jgi:hypothetical protein
MTARSSRASRRPRIRGSVETPPLPTCGTCPFGFPAANDAGTLICRAMPPSAFVGPTGATSSTYPPVGRDKTGCAMHPDWPKGRG